MGDAEQRPNPTISSEVDRPSLGEKVPFLLWFCLEILGLSPIRGTIRGHCMRLWNWRRDHETLNEGESQSYGLVFFLVLLAVVTCHFVDLSDIFVNYVGKEHDTVFIISYLTYLPHLTIVMLFCLAGRLYLSLGYDPAKHRLAVFSAEYLEARSANGYGTLWWRFGGFMALPTACMIMKFMVFLRKSGSAYCPRNAYVFIRVIGGVAGFALYGCFCFVIYCLRVSHCEEFERVALEISKRRAAEIETTKADIRRLCFGYRSFRDFVGMWLMLSLSIGILGMAFMIPYTMDTVPEIRKQLPAEESNLILWTVYIWSNKILFLFEPLLAVGGLDVEHPWQDFRECILQGWDRDPRVINNPDNKGGQRAGQRTDSKTLRGIIKHVKLLQDDMSWIKPTLISSIISIYLATTLDPSQDMDAWIGLACRNASHTG